MILQGRSRSSWPRHRPRPRGQGHSPQCDRADYASPMTAPTRASSRRHCLRPPAIALGAKRRSYLSFRDELLRQRATGHCAAAKGWLASLRIADEAAVGNITVGLAAAGLRAHLFRTCLTYLLPSKSKAKMTTPTKLFEPYKLGPITLPNRARDGAADAQPRGRRHGAESVGGGILRPARLRGPVDHRGEPGLAAGPGLSGHARHLLEGAGRRLAQGDRSRARSAAGASSFSSGMSAAFRTPRCSRTAAPRSRLRAIRAKGKTFVGGTFTDISEPRALALEEIPGIIEGFGAARRMRCRPASTASRSTAPTAICWISSPRTAPTSAPTPMADRSRTAPG